MMDIPYQFGNKVIVRNPLLGFAPDKLTLANIESLLSQQWFREAIYVASPSLYDAAMRWHNGETDKTDKLIASLSKYYARMMTRCTPFGLFASCGVIDWGTETTKTDRYELRRHTRFDMVFLCALAEKLAKQNTIREQLIYYPNSSYHVVGKQLRYVEYHYKNGHRVHQISSTPYTDYLQKVVEGCINGGLYHDLVALLTEDDITQAEAQAYLNELIDAQVLVHELEPAITGDEFTRQIIGVITRISQDTDNQDLKDLLDQLKAVETLLTALDKGLGNEVEDYRSIIAVLQKFDIKIDESRMFQVDLFRQFDEGAALDTYWQKPILKALSFLNRLQKNQKSRLSSFVRRFQERYETQEVPLLLALDAEMGVSYREGTSKGSSGLIAGINLNNGRTVKDKISWSKTDKWLFERLLEASQKNEYCIQLDEQSITSLEANNWENVPPSMALMCSLVNNEGVEKLSISDFSGSSAVNLLGRFAHGNTAILDEVLQICAQEQGLNEEVIFAEIVHLPENRTGNVLLHPVFREYEIPYLAKSSLPTDKQIPLQDLYVSVKGSHVVLRSKKHNKIIIPRLSNAHNYSANPLPIYEFLCDIQTQNMRSSFSFGWGEIGQQFKFLPRVEIENIVLSVATWQLSKDDFVTLVQSKGSVEAVEIFRSQWQLPRFLVLSDGDNELFVDCQNSLTVQALIDTIKSRDTIVLKEFLHNNTDKSRCDEAGNPLICQYVIPLIKNSAVYPSKRLLEPDSPTQRSFTVGSEWLYFKVYCGVQVADKILATIVPALTTELAESNLIDKWFFIRYADPEQHLRLRFHLYISDFGF